jgi:hypothetical protein
VIVARADASQRWAILTQAPASVYDGVASAFDAIRASNRKVRKQSTTGRRLCLSRMSRKTTRDLKPAPWGGFGYTRTREYQIPRPPRNQNPKRDSSKALKRRFSQTVIQLAARG